MLALISPAKKIDFNVDVPEKVSKPLFVEESTELISHLRKLSPKEISKLMSVSPAIADLNYERYMDWEPKFTKKKARPAAFVFDGEVYRGLAAKDMTDETLQYSQDHLLILSGLYGALRPLDLIHAYRLEMGTKFGVNGGKHLYDFWGDKITDQVNKTLKKQKEKTLVNLASNEYFKSVDKKQINGEIITPNFKEEKDGQFKSLMVYAKKARGFMARYMLENKIETAEDLKAFNIEGYKFNPELSKGNNWIFTRKQPAPKK